MKSYSVKSNAKRFARGVAAKYPEKLEAIEPFETNVDGVREWFPFVRITVKVCTPGAQQAFLDEFGAVALIQWKGLLLNGGPDPAILAEGDSGVYAIPAEDMSELAEADGPKVIGYAKTGPLEDASGLKEMFNGVPLAGKITMIQHRKELIPQAEVAGDMDKLAERIGEIQGDGPAFTFPGFTGDGAEDLANAMAERGVKAGWIDAAGSPHLPEIPVLTAENSTFILSASGRRMIEERDRLQSLKDADAIRDFEIIDVGEDGSVSSNITFHPAVESVTISADILAGIAASLPPRVESSREEIDRRRAERRARIDAEKATGARTPSGDKVKGISKKKKILDLITRPDGAAQAELEAATGWQRHTIRGYIAGTLRKTLAPVGVIECRKGRTADDAKETRYVFVKHAAMA